jgi:hypothetical protein
MGATIGQRTGIQAKPRADGTPGPPPKGLRGVINRGLIAANIVLEGAEQSAERLVSEHRAVCERDKQLMYALPS